MEDFNKSKEFNEKFLGSYQQELSDPTNKNHQFDSEKTARMLPPLPKNWQQV